MCGIVGVYCNELSVNVLKNLYDLFVNQKNRGIDGAGVSINNNQNLFRFRSHSPYRVFNVYNYNIWGALGNDDKVMFHHRLPSSTINKPRYNHPISNEDKTIHICHNGTISNYSGLYKELKNEHIFETENKGKFTDSEVVVHLFEDGLSKYGNIYEALEYVYEKLEGAFAIIIHIEKDKDVYMMRYERPLTISRDKSNNFYYSSEFQKINDLKKLYELSNGEIGKLTKKGYETITKKNIQTSNTIDYKTYFGYSGNLTKYKKKKNSKNKITKELQDFILTTKLELLLERPDIDYNKLCLKIYSAIDDYDPQIDIYDKKVREEVKRIITEEKVY